MSNRESGPAIVVGIDGSKSAMHAALWAIDEAVHRDVPLRLVYVVDVAAHAHAHAAAATPATGTSDVQRRQATARAALYDVLRAIDATGKPVIVETDILWGRPLTKLMQESRSALMVCVGSIGLNHARSGQGSVAGALAGSSLCPVAVIQQAPDGTVTPHISSVVAEVDNGSVLRHAFAEARLRGVPLRAVSVQANHVDDQKGSEQGQLDRRLSRWTRLYPDVPVEPALVRTRARRYMADHAEPGQLFVTDAHTAQLCSVYGAGSSVLTVRCGNL
ncbi:universal stress protein [Mycobacterium asiaticum]|uniref:Universal stress protein n=1 Tax=Mycobacterium asiaticum TaxID=1790 RepID=A0A1A3MZ61_MYCAS|nr:universal stress protein [Mycobacterium asiaticum]OBK14370.1 universal stress protein [Mycobacterium asiaticum]